MKFSDVMAHYNYKIVNIVRSLHVARETVNSWKKEDCIPFKMQCIIQVLTDSKLKADREGWEKGQIV